VSASIALHAGVIGRALWLLSGVVLPTMSLAEGAGGDGLRRGDFAIYSRTSTQSLPLPALPAMLASDEMDETEYRPNVPLDTSERKFQKLSLRESNADADDAGWLGPFPQKQLAVPVFRNSVRGAATGADHNASDIGSAVNDGDGGLGGDGFTGDAPTPAGTNKPPRYPAEA
jgi:hypothetical protein